ncbi:MAG: hypothetical protein AABZ14_04725, partial [Candidatus Margulisiibacteriota bacterium]
MVSFRMKAKYIFLTLISALGLFLFVYLKTASFTTPLSSQMPTKSQISQEADLLFGKMLSAEPHYKRKWITYESSPGIKQLTSDQITKFFGDPKILLELGLIYWTIRYENAPPFKEVRLQINPFGKLIGYKILVRPETDPRTYSNLTFSKLKDWGLFTNWKTHPSSIEAHSLDFLPNWPFKGKGTLSLKVESQNQFITGVRVDYCAPTEWTENLSPKLFMGQLLSGIGFLSYSFASFAGLILIGVALSRHRITASSLWVSGILTGLIFVSNYAYMANN